jgi:hypothetical protein
VLPDSEIAAIPIGGNFSCDFINKDCGEMTHSARLVPIGRNMTTWLYDFGQNWAGITELSVRGLPAGTRILVRHAEILSACGDVLPQQCIVPQPTPGTYSS